MIAALPLSIGAGRVVGLRYRMYNRQNDLLEDRSTGEPVFYLQGGSSIMPGLQRQLEGLVPGAQKEVTLCLAEDGAGPDYRFTVDVLSVRSATAAELQLGYPLPPTINCGPDCDCYSETTTGEK